MSFNVVRTFICKHCNEYTHDNPHEARVHYEDRHDVPCPKCGKNLLHLIAPVPGFVAGQSYDLDPPDRV